MKKFIHLRVINGFSFSIEIKIDKPEGEWIAVSNMEAEIILRKRRNA